MTLLSMRSCSQVERAGTWCSGGHGFYSWLGFRFFFLCPTLVLCDQFTIHFSQPLMFLYTILTGLKKKYLCHILSYLASIKLPKKDRKELCNFRNIHIFSIFPNPSGNFQLSYIHFFKVFDLLEPHPRRVWILFFWNCSIIQGLP